MTLKWTIIFAFMLRITVFLLVFIVYCPVWGQSELKRKAIKVKKTSEVIQVDGELSEDIWSETTVADGFIQYFPTDTSIANSQSEIYMAYTDSHLYVGIKCIAPGNDWRVNSLKRDYRAGGNDNITLVFDSFQDKTNAFFFGINPEGIIREGVITNGGSDFSNFDESWDNKWRGEAKKFDNYFSLV